MLLKQTGATVGDLNSHIPSYHIDELQFYHISDFSNPKITEDSVILIRFGEMDQNGRKIFVVLLPHRGRQLHMHFCGHVKCGYLW